MNTKLQKFKEGFMRIIFTLCACMSIIAVILICLFSFANGIPTMGKIGVTKFLFGTVWKPLENFFGILPMIIGSIYVTAGAIIIGVPIGLLCAVFLAKFCPKWLYKFLKPAVDLLAGLAGLLGHQRVAQHLARMGDGLLDRLRQPHAALGVGTELLKLALSAPAGVDLALDHIERAGKRLGRALRLVRLQDGYAFGNRRAEAL